MHNQWPEDKLVFLLGNDAFAKLHTWHGWQQLLDVAHLAVMQRPHETKEWSPEVKALAQRHQVNDIDKLHQSPNGAIICLPTPK